jgi:hypothetical protein
MAKKIMTKHGDIDEDTLEKREGKTENRDRDGSLHDTAEWVEYYDKVTGELVHRSAHVTLHKMPPGMDAVAAKLFG